MAHIRLQLRLRIGVETATRRRADSGIHSGIFLSGSVRREKERIEHIVRRTGHAEDAVLYVPAYINSHLYIVMAMADGNHVGVGVDVLLKELRIPVVRSKS